MPNAAPSPGYVANRFWNWEDFQTQFGVWNGVLLFKGGESNICNSIQLFRSMSHCTIYSDANPKGQHPLLLSASCSPCLFRGLSWILPNLLEKVFRRGAYGDCSVEEGAGAACSVAEAGFLCNWMLANNPMWIFFTELSCALWDLLLSRFRTAMKICVEAMIILRSGSWTLCVSAEHT